VNARRRNDGEGGGRGALAEWWWCIAGVTKKRAAFKLSWLPFWKEPVGRVCLLLCTTPSKHSPSRGLATPLALLGPDIFVVLLA